MALTGRESIGTVTCGAGPTKKRAKKSSPPQKRGGLLFFNGGGAEIRTPDTADMSRML